MCPLTGGGPTEYQATLVPMVSPPTIGTGVQAYPGGGADGAAREALGAQYALLWFDTPRQGWTVAFSPGALDATTARTAILASLATRFLPGQVEYLDQRLTLLPTPYSYAELASLAGQLAAISDIVAAGGIGCSGSDAVRYELNIAPVATPDVVARVQAAIAPFEDRVHVTYGTGFAQADVGVVPSPSPSPSSSPPPPGSPTPPRVADYVTLPKASRCVRGRSVAFKVAKDGAVRAVTLAAGKRSATAASGKRGALRLKSRRTSVKVTVEFRDGRTAAQTLIYRRCGAEKPRP